MNPSASVDGGMNRLEQKMKPEKAARRVIGAARKVAELTPEHCRSEAGYRRASTVRMSALRRAIKDLDAAMEGKPWHAVDWSTVVAMGLTGRIPRGGKGLNAQDTRAKRHTRTGKR